MSEKIDIFTMKIQDLKTQDTNKNRTNDKKHKTDKHCSASMYNPRGPLPVLAFFLNWSLSALSKRLT